MYHIISYHISYHIISYHIVYITYIISYYIICHISYLISYHIYNLLWNPILENGLLTPRWTPSWARWTAVRWTAIWRHATSRCQFETVDFNKRSPKVNTSVNKCLSSSLPLCVCPVAGRGSPVLVPYKVI